MFDGGVRFKVCLHRGRRTKSKKVVAFVQHRKNIYSLCWSADESRSLTAGGVKLLCSPVVLQQILLYLLSDGSRLDRRWLGWVLSFGFFRAH